MATEEEAKQLARSTLATKSVRFYGVPVNITEDRLAAFFVRYGKVYDVSETISKTGIATRVFLIPTC